MKKTRSEFQKNSLITSHLRQLYSIIEQVESQARQVGKWEEKELFALPYGQVYTKKKEECEGILDKLKADFEQEMRRLETLCAGKNTIKHSAPLNTDSCRAI